MRFCSLGSGSTGNASLIESCAGTRTTRVLLDCGFSQRELIARLARVGVGIEQIDAMFITHEHGDHVGCAVGLSRRHRIPLWMSRGTWRAINRLPAPSDTLFAPDEQADAPVDLGTGTVIAFARDGLPIDLPGLRLLPFTVPHDAREPLQVVFSDSRDRRLGVLTDAGCATTHLLKQLGGCHALLLECNHDSALLAASAYPASLKARIGGRLGHLSNEAASSILVDVAHGGLRHVVAAHLSERNNSPSLARSSLAHAIGAHEKDILVADPKQGTQWLTVE
ncbi:MAG: MBL fold metallo-hydrolase [Ideonella sp.]